MSSWAKCSLFYHRRLHSFHTLVGFFQAFFVSLVKISFKNCWATWWVFPINIVIRICAWLRWSWCALFKHPALMLMTVCRKLVDQWRLPPEGATLKCSDGWVLSACTKSECCVPSDSSWLVVILSNSPFWSYWYYYFIKYFLCCITKAIPTCPFWGFWRIQKNSKMTITVLPFIEKYG